MCFPQELSHLCFRGLTNSVVIICSSLWCAVTKYRPLRCQSISVNTDIHLYFICICLKSPGMKLWWLLNNIKNSFVFYGKKNTAYTVWYDMKETSWLNFHIWMNYSFNVEWGHVTFWKKIHYITSAKCFCKETETPSVLMRIRSESHNIKCTVTDVWAVTHSREDCALGKMKLSWEYFTNISQSLIELCCLMRKTQCLLQSSLFPTCRLS